ncbi:RNA polymerase sigma factor SigI [Herbivorax sp. ANBcel31]|uniref:RNA polymerase sigma factor SigI n=1 Tax=Herbivorax sp. ANBcel31 TaxID=3069754 RepID=UPI0027B3FCF5|nr:RNA polymerase sigma factor SigI [Herbivorax sp. ANBcel31]MDQ2085147.1 RNA polymerase sigma factor SigI [Herbivorax sp. ANBcel31]
MHPNVINQRVESIKNSEEDINKFVEEYKPFIAACAKKVAGRYVSYGCDDELSIGLIAFVEAIKAYKSSKGNFLSFSQNVIKRRIIDYYRKEKKHAEVLSLKSNNNDEESEIDLSVMKSLENYSKEEASEYRRLELQQLSQELEEWNISFLELVKISPKHKSTRLVVSQIVRFILSRREMLEGIKKSKTIPMAEIEKHLKIPRKKIERFRKYIITVLLIYTGDYQFIKEYVNYINGI